MGTHDLHGSRRRAAALSAGVVASIVALGLASPLVASAGASAAAHRSSSGPAKHHSSSGPAKHRSSSGPAKHRSSSGPAKHRSSSGSAQAEARTINMRSSDLPPTKPAWKAESVPGNGKATQAAARKAAACMQKLGAGSGDAFATLGLPAKNALASVSSPQFYQPGLTQLPGANSEVVIVSSPAVAAKDLAALQKPAARACLAAQYLVDTEASGSGKVKITTSAGKGPGEKKAKGALHIRFTASGGNFPAGLELYNDEYFYVSGHAEVVFSFLDLGSPFPAKWSAQAIAKVMARAAKVAS